MKLTPAQRAQVRDLFGGRCGFCGDPLGERWHADHFEPVRRELVRTKDGGLSTGAKCERPHLDVVANLLPSCGPCNTDKSTFDIEHWRLQISRTREVLARDVATFRRAVRFGLVQVTTEPVIFHFEKVAMAEAQGSGEVYYGSVGLSDQEAWEFRSMIRYWIELREQAAIGARDLLVPNHLRPLANRMWARRGLVHGGQGVFVFNGGEENPTGAVLTLVREQPAQERDATGVAG